MLYKKHRAIVVRTDRHLIPAREASRQDFAELEVSKLHDALLLKPPAQKHILLRTAIHFFEGTVR